MLHQIPKLDYGGFSLVEYLLSKNKFRKRFKVLDIGGALGNHCQILRAYGLSVDIIDKYEKEAELVGDFNKYNFKTKGPCLRCFMPEQPHEENNCETEGIFAPTAGIIGTLQASEVLKTIIGLKDDLNKNILVFNSLTMSLRKIKIKKNSKCLNKCL